MKKGNFEVGFRQAATFPGGLIRDRLTTKSPGNWSNLSYLQGGQLVKEHDKRFNPAKQHEPMKEAFKIVYRADCEAVLPVLEEAANGHFISSHYPPDT
jgi:hypothetical protein